VLARFAAYRRCSADVRVSAPRGVRMGIVAGAAELNDTSLGLLIMSRLQCSGLNGGGAGQAHVASPRLGRLRMPATDCRLCCGPGRPSAPRGGRPRAGEGAVVVQELELPRFGGRVDCGVFSVGKTPSVWAVGAVGIAKRFPRTSWSARPFAPSTGPAASIAPKDGRIMLRMRSGARPLRARQG
jgi:hypothetical protein